MRLHSLRELAALVAVSIYGGADFGLVDGLLLLDFDHLAHQVFHLIEALFYAFNLDVNDLLLTRLRLKDLDATIDFFYFLSRRLK